MDINKPIEEVRNETEKVLLDLNSNPIYADSKIEIIDKIKLYNIGSEEYKIEFWKWLYTYIVAKGWNRFMIYYFYFELYLNSFMEGEIAAEFDEFYSHITGDGFPADGVWLRFHDEKHIQNLPEYIRDRKWLDLP